MTAQTQIIELVERWAHAEEHNDAGLLGPLLTEDFVGVGPVGFVIDREQWLGRFDKGLENRSFAVEEPRIRDYGTSAVIVGVQVQETEVKGRDSSGRFRVTLVAVRSGDAWRLAHVHIGPLDYPGCPADLESADLGLIDLETDRPRNRSKGEQ